MAEETGFLDLDSFFDEWIYGTGYPRLQIAWSYSSGWNDDYAFDLLIEQVQQETLFSQPLRVGWAGESDTLWEDIVLSGKQTRYKHSWPFAPRALLVNTERGLLCKSAIVSEPLPDGVVEKGLYLAQNHPNPFHGSRGESTTLGFQIPSRQVPAMVSLLVFDLTGKQVCVLLQKELTAGYYRVEWDGRDEWGGTLPVGTYFCVLNAGGEQHLRKLVLM